MSAACITALPVSDCAPRLKLSADNRSAGVHHVYWDVADQSF